MGFIASLLYSLEVIMRYTRKCPSCLSLLEHNLKNNRDAAEKKGRVCKKCSYKLRDQSGDKNPFFGKSHSKEVKEIISNGDKSYWKDLDYRKQASKRMMGKNNPMYGRCNHDIWVEKFGKDEADHRREAVNKKLSIAFSGEKNPMYGKPSPGGCGNGWSGWYKNWFFRSLLELSYLVNVIEKNGRNWRSAETKDLEIRYVGWKGSEMTYRADFFVDEKYLIEVKPKKLQSSRLVQLKAKAAEEFCSSHGFEYKIEEPIMLTVEEVKRLRQNEIIKFTDRYEKLFMERFE
jgi:hypothetical protein